MKEKLTTREQQILEMLAEGNTDNDIGKILYLSPKTVKAHVERIRWKLKARNRAHAVAIGYQTRLLEVEYQQQFIVLEGASA